MLAEVCQHIVVLEKGKTVKDIMTSEATLKELENYFSGEAVVVEEGEEEDLEQKSS